MQVPYDAIRRGSQRSSENWKEKPDIAAYVIQTLAFASLGTTLWIARTLRCNRRSCRYSTASM